MEKHYLVLDQYRESSEYNDFLGKFYHFPKKYLNLLSQPNIEFVYYEPKKNGDGVYFGYGKICKEPFEDKRESNHYFVEIAEYKPFTDPVPFENGSGPREVKPFYNPQNAVRRIENERLEGICLDGGIQLNFKADAHLITVLGEQLIASEKVGILELVKNSYDAGATYCKVIIEKVASLPQIDKSQYEFDKYEGPVIVIEDDGIGMTKEVIENGWLRPASTLKTNIKERLKNEKEAAIQSGRLGAFQSLTRELQKEYKNRVPLGEKGVGRFAAHRLGKYLVIKTKPRNLEYEYVLNIDWTKFDMMHSAMRDLDSIGVSLRRQELSRNYGETDSGTQIIIYGGRKGFEWTEETVEQLNRTIHNLNSPNPNPDKNRTKFQAMLVCPQIPDLKERDYINDYPPNFTFDGLVDETGLLDYKINFNPPNSVPMTPDEESYKIDLRANTNDQDYWRIDSQDSLRYPECGPFFIHLDIWYRAKPWVDGPDSREFLNYLYDFGGISIYRDGINILPSELGAETDWLGLAKRHEKVGSRISYYNMIGNIEIDQFDNLALTDKTDREGLIRNRAYYDLVKLIQPIIINIAEQFFRFKRDIYSNLTKGITRDPEILGGNVADGAKLVSKIKENYPIMEDPFSILSQLGESMEREDKLINLESSLKNLKSSLELIEEAQNLLTEQAGFGLAIAVSVHEIAKITSNFYNGVNEIIKSSKFDKEKLNDLQEASSSLKSELKRLSPLRAIRNEKRMEFGVYKVLKFTREMFKRRFEKLGIEFNIDHDSDIDIYARYGAIVQIFSNLFDNSCYWLNTLSRSRKRIISVKINSKDRFVIIADTGPGIHDSIRPYLFQPGYSLKIPPSGLGLYISKYYMQSFKGDIYLTTERERLKDFSGAQFTIDFAKVPSKGWG